MTQLTEESRNEKSSTDSVSACGHSPTDAEGEKRLLYPVACSWYWNESHWGGVGRGHSCGAVDPVMLSLCCGISMRAYLICLRTKELL